jgi:hypothetical protein
MVPTSFDEANCVLDKPPDMSYEECECLSVFRGKTEEDMPVVISCWKATKEELEQINKTGRVRLVVYGGTMFPATLSGLPPFIVE